MREFIFLVSLFHWSSLCAVLWCAQNQVIDSFMPRAYIYSLKMQKAHQQGRHEEKNKKMSGRTNNTLKKRKKNLSRSLVLLVCFYFSLPASSPSLLLLFFSRDVIILQCRRHHVFLFCGYVCACVMLRFPFSSLLTFFLLAYCNKNRNLVQHRRNLFCLFFFFFFFKCCTTQPFTTFYLFFYVFSTLRFSFSSSLTYKCVK